MLEIHLHSQSFRPGEPVRATIRLALAKPVKARSLAATLECFEKRRVEVQKVLDQYELDRRKELGIPPAGNMITTTEERSSTIFSREQVISGETDYSRGEYRVSFPLPADAKPTSREFGHDGKIHVWTLRAKLDVPRAIDENAETEVIVSGLSF